MKKRHLMGAAAALLATATVLSACAPGGSSSSSTKSPSGISTDVSGEAVTLKMLDFWQNEEGKWMDSVVAGFEKEHPNIKIQRTTQDWGQVMNTLNLRLADPNGPDIALVNNGWQSMGTLAKGGRILNLDAYASAYGWKDAIPSTILRQEQFTSDGKQMGTGSVYAVPAARSSLIGLYYNKAILDKLGIAVPKTLAEFEKAAAAVKAGGQIPIAYGSQDKGSSTAILFALQDLYGSAKDIEDFVYSSGSVPITSTGITQAATAVKKWSDAGWLTPNHEGIPFADSMNNFLAGKGAFQFNYTGSLGFSAAQKQTFGYVQLPQANGDKVVGTGSTVGNLAISSKSKHPDAAAAFLDYLASKATAQASVDHGYLPLLHNDVKQATPGPELATEITAQQKLTDADGFVPYFDWSTPTMLDTIGGQVQLLLAGKSTPDQLAAAGQKDYDTFQAQRAKG
ncbi:raffinose/stachyose/melibiose transport system substrate-binding protein [Kribbella aluminosa]|uniref:Raffinose/stachyose/melibiose transport system substrate-binding protein n=1 Tax=Kribbella aluminosa TaxID=416017 RepID=A0ABS4UJ48_9ACTN|nr:extracellular solute-binding protein [Kribbella aluminosa]MBP2351643.1 raffinose/stachyose/melibiose transport system substrate-binding protein [Kribbella aluminosa]